MKKSKYIHIRIDGADRKKVSDIAHDYGMTLSEYIRALVARGAPPTTRDRLLARDQIAECITRNLGIAGIAASHDVVRAIAANIAMGIEEYGYRAG